MARLRNRITKADFYTDPELLRWPRDKREFYRRLWAIAEDSGCLEDDPFGWKLLLYPSPLDADITLELMSTWRDELERAGKLVPYADHGKSYLYVRNFHQHEKPRNPQEPDLPLPPWVHYQRSTILRGDKEVTRHGYNVDSVPMMVSQDDVNLTLTSSQDDVTTRACVRSVRSGPVQSGPGGVGGNEQPVENGAPVHNFLPSDENPNECKHSEHDPQTKPPKCVRYQAVWDRCLQIAWPAGKDAIRDIVGDEIMRLMDAAKGAKSHERYLAKCLAAYEPPQPVVDRLQAAKRAAQGAGGKRDADELPKRIGETLEVL